MCLRVNHAPKAVGRSLPEDQNVKDGLVLPLLVLAAPSWADKRVALVIGNAVYAHAPRLANPLNAIADIGAALERLGFAVTRLENADYAALRRGLLEFTRAASASEIAVVFYAGHGHRSGPA